MGLDEIMMISRVRGGGSRRAMINRAERRWNSAAGVGTKDSPFVVRETREV
jgi:hypothetical protein